MTSKSAKIFKAAADGNLTFVIWDNKYTLHYNPKDFHRFCHTALFREILSFPWKVVVNRYTHIHTIHANILFSWDGINIWELSIVAISKHQYNSFNLSMFMFVLFNRGIVRKTNCAIGLVGLGPGGSFGIPFRKIGLFWHFHSLVKSKKLSAKSQTVKYKYCSVLNFIKVGFKKSKIF